jgi:hypothetical protein
MTSNTRAPSGRTHARRRPWRAAAAALLLPALAACAGSTLHWPQRLREDPAPSGPGYLRAYKESHFRALGRGFRRGLTSAAFFDRLAAARVLFLGDHHGDRRLHARILRLLSEVERSGRRYELGLECIGTQDMPMVERFLAGHLDLDDLARAVRSRWPDAWLEGEEVDSAFYRQLLLHARQAARPVFALEPTPRLPLYERDQAMAQSILQRARADAGALLVVVVGETHLLGHGQLAGRVGLPYVAVCGSLSLTLRGEAAEARFNAEHRFAETSSEVLFFLPLEEPTTD